jgi:hypothetical protein
LHRLFRKIGLGTGSTSYIKKIEPAVLQILRDYQPPIVICADEKSAKLMLELKKKNYYLGKVAVLALDYSVDSETVADEVDLYVFSNTYVGIQLEGMGVPKSKLGLCKTFLPDNFISPVPREQALAKTGLLTTMPSVLLVVRNTDLTAIKDVFLRLLRLGDSCQVILSGSRKEFLDEIIKVTAPPRHPVKIVEYPNQLEVFMSAAKCVVVSINDRISISQAAALKLPVIVVGEADHTNTLSFLIKNQLAAFGRIPAESAFLIETAIEGKKINNPEKAYKVLGRAEEGREVVDLIALLKPPKELKVKNYKDK